MSIKLNLKRPVRPDWNLEPDDVLLTKGALSRLGYYEAPDWGTTPYPDASMFDGIKSFQRNEKLDVDGVINPDGPTLERLGHALTRNLTGDNDNCTNCEQRQPVASKTGRCEAQAQRDEAICRMLVSPVSRQGCWNSVQDRYGACIKGAPLPPLVTY